MQHRLEMVNKSTDDEKSQITIGASEYKNLKYQIHQCLFQLETQRDQLRDYHLIKHENEKLKNQLSVLQAEYEKTLLEKEESRSEKEEGKVKKKKRRRKTKRDKNLKNEKEESQDLVQIEKIPCDTIASEDSTKIELKTSNKVDTDRGNKSSDHSDLVNHVIDLTLKLANSNAERDQKDLELRELQNRYDSYLMERCLRAVEGRSEIGQDTQQEERGLNIIPTESSPARGAIGKKLNRTRKSTLELVTSSARLLQAYRHNRCYKSTPNMSMNRQA